MIDINQIDNLKKDYGVLSTNELEEKYKTSYSSIQRFCNKYNIKTKRGYSSINSYKYKKLFLMGKEFVEDWINNIISIDEMADKYECPKTALYSRARTIGICRKTLKDKIDINQLIQDYQSKMKVKDILIKYDICDSTLERLLKSKISIDSQGSRRKYDLNENYFDEIDSEMKAYYMGLFYADGSNSEDRGCLTITLKEEDLYILQKLFSELKYDRPIIKTYNKIYNKSYYMASISSKYLSNKFKEYGCMQNKSFKIIFPDWLNANLYSHFIRGYFDGDGCITYNTNEPNRVCVDFSGNYDFLLKVQEILINNCNINKTQLHKNKNIFTLDINGRYQVSRVLQYLYKDATIFLHRKYNKVIELEDLKVIDLKENVNG